MAMKTTRAQESRSKPKPRTVAPDFWAFLEEIDAPQWVDLALQGNSNGERDDSWFDTLHPFHQRSFQDLVSPGVKVKGRGYVSAGKLSSFKSHNNDSLGANSGFYKPSNSTEVECFTTVSTSSDNESRNPMVGKSESSRACDLQNRPIVPQHTTAMPRSNGLVASLKSINLRRSGGALPALRVEVKGQQQSRNGRSSASKFNTVDEKSRKDCETANAENKTALAKMKTKTVLTAKLAPGQSIEDRKRGDLSMQIETVSRPPLRDVNSVSNPLYKSVTGQYHGSAAAGKENDTLCTTLHQRGHMRERMKPLRSIKHGAYNHWEKNHGSGYFCLSQGQSEGKQMSFLKILVFVKLLLCTINWMASESTLRSVKYNTVHPNVLCAIILALVRRYCCKRSILNLQRED